MHALECACSPFSLYSNISLQWVFTVRPLVLLEMSWNPHVVFLSSTLLCLDVQNYINGLKCKMYLRSLSVDQPWKFSLCSIVGWFFTSTEWNLAHIIIYIVWWSVSKSAGSLQRLCKQCSPVSIYLFQQISNFFHRIHIEVVFFCV